jgi:hypothetical protein
MHADAAYVGAERERWAYRTIIGSICLSTSLTINDVHTTIRGTLLFPDDRYAPIVRVTTRRTCLESVDALRHWMTT